MINSKRKIHWEKIYQTKDMKDLSWYQPSPKISIDFIKQFNIPVEASIIDIGGGDSLFVDHLLELGYQNITILDISESALSRARLRLGASAKKVKWIVADASTFKPTEKYDFWHDRAAFHFLTQEHEINHYLNTIKLSIKPRGILVMGTFSENGQKKCSGLDITQYSETSMTKLLNEFFDKIKCLSVDHITPLETVQNFIFCSFRKTSPN